MQPALLPLGGAKKIYSKNVSSSFERKNDESKGILFCMAVMIITSKSKKVIINERYMIDLLPFATH